MILSIFSPSSNASPKYRSHGSVSGCFLFLSVHFFLNCHGTGEDTKEKRPEQKISKFSVQTCDKCHGTNREAGSPSERMVTDMQTAPVTDTELRSDQKSGEELADTLFCPPLAQLPAFRKAVCGAGRNRKCLRPARHRCARALSAQAGKSTGS